MVACTGDALLQNGRSRPCLHPLEEGKICKTNRAVRTPLFATRDSQ
jgi:hypothetical protein